MDDRPERSEISCSLLELKLIPNANIVVHPNGSTSVRLSLKNLGPERAKRVRVVLDSFIALTNKRENQAYAAQFTGQRLQVTGKALGFDLNKDEVVEVLLVRGEKGPAPFFVDGHDKETSEPKSFHTPTGRYQMTVTASSLDGGSHSLVFVLSRRKNGLLSIKQIQSAP